MSRTMRRWLYVVLFAVLFCASIAALTMDGPEATESDNTARLRKEIERKKTELAGLEAQLAAEEKKQREKLAAQEQQEKDRLAAQKQSEESASNAETTWELGPGSAATSGMNNHKRSLEREFALNVLSDQKTFWTSPARFRLDDVTWLVPFGAVTGGLIASDTSIEKELPTSTSLINHSQTFANLGTASLVGAAGAFYLWGKHSRDDHAQETGILSAEALANSFLSLELIKVGTGRQRPLEGNGKGDFFHGGSSFPSQHSAAAWSVASIIAHEYPGTLTQLLAYGTASAVSISRLLGRNHFSSDVFVGGALGWYMGRQVYRARHNPEVGGAEWGTFERSPETWKPNQMGSPYVPMDSWIYPAFERLAALGYVRTGFAGVRPWTRMECARLLEEAAGSISQDESSEVFRIQRELQTEFAAEVRQLGGGRNLGIQLESIYTRFTGISGTPLTDGYHFGQTIINDYGRPYQEGLNAITGLSASGSAGPLAFYLRGEYQHSPSAPALSEQARETIAAVDWNPPLPVPPASPVPELNRLRLIEAYVTVNLENWQISFGKQNLYWGPGVGGPMMWSNNAEPIPMLRVNRVSPFKLPSIFGKLLGPIRTEFFIGRLAGQQFVFLDTTGLVGKWGQPLTDQPFVHGLRMSFKPTPNFEFGVSNTSLFSGPGVPFTFHTFFKSFSFGNAPFGSLDDPGDRRSGFDFTYRIPKLRKWLTFYGDGFADDQISPLAYPDRSAWRAGLYLPQIPGVPKLDLRVEGVYTDLPIGGGVSHGFFYSNVHYRAGYSSSGNLLGNWIGRQGQGAQAWSTYHFSPRNSVQVGYRHQKVSQEFITGGGTLTDASVSSEYWIRSNLSLSGLVQYETWAFPVLAPGAQTNVAASFQVTYRPAWGFRK